MESVSAWKLKRTTRAATLVIRFDGIFVKVVYKLGRSTQASTLLVFLLDRRHLFSPARHCLSLSSLMLPCYF